MATYVCSDLHGSFDLLMCILKKVNFTKFDTLCIIGDVIDKGLYPIELLKFCYEKPNVTLLMGNHELMMYRAYTIPGEGDLWFYNGGLYTCKQYERLPMSEQNMLFDYISNLPIIVKDVKVHDKTYYLSHATFYNGNLPNEKTVFTLSDFSMEEVQNLLWKRMYPFPKSNFPGTDKNKILIAGHTIGCKLQNNNYNGKAFIYKKNGHYINVDCGLACRHSLHNAGFKPRIGMLRLEDMKEFYIEA